MLVALLMPKNVIGRKATVVYLSPKFALFNHLLSSIKTSLIKNSMDVEA